MIQWATEKENPPIRPHEKDCDRSLSEEGTHTAGGVAGSLSFHPYPLRRHLCSGTLVSREAAPVTAFDLKAYPAYGYYPLLGLKEIIVTRAGHTVARAPLSAQM